LPHPIGGQSPPIGTRDARAAGLSGCRLVSPVGRQAESPRVLLARATSRWLRWKHPGRRSGAVDVGLHWRPRPTSEAGAGRIAPGFKSWNCSTSRTTSMSGQTRTFITSDTKNQSRSLLHRGFQTRITVKSARFEPYSPVRPNRTRNRELPSRMAVGAACRYGVASGTTRLSSAGLTMAT
jgi:hypothetical protein